MLQIKIKEKSYSNTPILQDIQLSISHPGLYGIVGANGAGKTTFFKCLSSLVSFEGEILYQGSPLSSGQVAFIPTEPYLYDHLTVGEFYSFYRKLLGIKTVEKYTI